MSLKDRYKFENISCKRIVKYDVEELLASNLSIINHPIDIASVIRESKESSNDKPHLSY
ncbi:hypothetical protein GLOIN_2v1780397 [Rhizophagus irregularis DAOM 181602=DAOM 197198]|uniref:Uncharacterized protein n=1 Tax=Rhizophagus irregularis (strain DAOM 181602 / DAOM 197198 / MUCL 43194) TaxID=747089 RepID=U9TZE5_RHIID|nr:hypothetical protein GLOIN_2v1780397 [Rhizophagus irregularis DAOM 181602=DAOM 197198]POG66559.1 hypothetical protein GLOIN_2v1780397 [Rhizophagus irregularis DAOM 181602=DAOM 197198]GBC41993.1 hypothetical protein GLOIN_2v1780397 [Rhizophagus irregularis DAOM 181602=DAOM 197198]CAG8767114.1 6064_t:CDS:2 [Rhizophagus irregularis]|eukprot:XP_025173425.1 hypothetical protein GLOIN_2v1780397 [Rhizophagus irregularis DAOM 181602=DAOM 197198]